MDGQPEVERKPATAFPLATVCVVVLIILLAGVLIVPFLTQQGRGPGRQSECANNMRQISVAIFTYEATHNQYPSYVEVETVDGLPRKRPYIWTLTPYIERQDIFVFHAGYAGHGLDPAKETPIMPVLNCPSNPIFDQPINSYVVNTGMPDGLADATTPADWPENGVFHNAYPFDEQGNAVAVIALNSSSLRDGTSTTLMTSESLSLRLWSAMDEPSVGFVWHPTLDPPFMARMENEPIAGFDPYLLARPSSNHPGVVNVIFCDNHMQVLNTQIDYRVYCQLMAPHDAGVRPPGVNSEAEIPEAIRTTPLSEDDYR